MTISFIRLLVAAPLLPGALAIDAHSATLRILRPNQEFRATALPSSRELSTFARLLYEAFDEVDTARLDAPHFADGADAFLVNLVAPARSFTPTELTNLQTIFSGRRRALVFYENDAWRLANIQLADLLDAEYLAGPNADSVWPVAAHPLLEGIDERFRIGQAGRISGGVEIVADYATLRGPDDNVLLVGETSLLSDWTFPVFPSHLTFTRNTATFLAVPEPSTAFLCLLAALALATRRCAR